MKIGAISCVLALLLAFSASAGEPISEEQLVALVQEGVDTRLIVRLVQRDCVSFEADAQSILRLSDVVPSPVLHAALDCTEATAGSASSARAESPPAAAPAPAPEEVAMPTALAESSEMPAAEVKAEASRAPSAAAAPSMPIEADAPPLAADQLQTLAIVPARTGGKTNQELTTAVQDALRERGTRLALVENETMAAHYEADRPFNSGAPRNSLLAAARAAGADALLLIESSAYMQMGNRRIRFQSRLLETRAGEVVLRSGGDSSLPGLSWEEARDVVAGQVIAKVP
jgi:hypothetical protein